MGSGADRRPHPAVPPPPVAGAGDGRPGCLTDLSDAGAGLTDLGGTAGDGALTDLTAAPGTTEGGRAADTAHSADDGRLPDLTAASAPAAAPSVADAVAAHRETLFVLADPTAPPPGDPLAGPTRARARRGRDGIARRRERPDDDGLAADERWPGEPAPAPSEGDEPADGARGRGRGALAADPQERLQHALDLGYRYLGHRDRTVVEMRRHLERKRVEPQTIDEAVAALTEQGYLDDARYARQFAEDRRLLDAWGADRIARRLAAVGVADDLVEAALGAQDADGEREAALTLLRRRMPVAPDDDRSRERALGILVRKGYDLDLAYEVVRSYAREA